MPVTLDYGAYPHLLEAIVRFGDRATLLALRPVSKRARALAEARLFEHVAVVLDPAHDPATVILVEPRKPHNRLPFLVAKLHKTLLPLSCPTWEASVRAIRIADVHVRPENEALRHLISLLPVHAESSSAENDGAGHLTSSTGGVRLMRRRELGGRYEAEDVLTKLQAPAAVAYLDFHSKWPPQMTITSPLMHRVIVHVPLEAMRYPWIIRPREGHGCREAFIVLDQHAPFIPPAMALAAPQYMYHLIRHFFRGSGAQRGHMGPDCELRPPRTVVTVVGMERFHSDVPRAMREIAAQIGGPDGASRLETHLVGMRYAEWNAKAGEDAALEQQAELVPIEVRVALPQHCLRQALILARTRSRGRRTQTQALWRSSQRMRCPDVAQHRPPPLDHPGLPKPLSQLGVCAEQWGMLALDGGIRRLVLPSRLCLLPQRGAGGGYPWNYHDIPPPGCGTDCAGRCWWWCTTSTTGRSRRSRRGRCKRTFRTSPIQPVRRDALGQHQIPPTPNLSRRPCRLTTL